MFVPPAQAPAAPAVPFKPTTAEVFYGRGAVSYGPGAESMASVTDFQGQKRQTAKALRLALDGEDGENRPEDVVDHLMNLAGRPETTVEDLIDIIGRG